MRDQYLASSPAASLPIWAILLHSDRPLGYHSQQPPSREAVAREGGVEAAGTKLHQEGAEQQGLPPRVARRRRHQLRQRLSSLGVVAAVEGREESLGVGLQTDWSGTLWQGFAGGSSRSQLLCPPMPQQAKRYSCCRHAPGTTPAAPHQRLLPICVAQLAGFVNRVGLGGQGANRRRWAGAICLRPPNHNRYRLQAA